MTEPEICVYLVCGLPTDHKVAVINNLKYKHAEHYCRSKNVISVPDFIEYDMNTNDITIEGHLQRRPREDTCFIIDCGTSIRIFEDLWNVASSELKYDVRPYLCSVDDHSLFLDFETQMPKENAAFIHVVFLAASKKQHAILDRLEPYDGINVEHKAIEVEVGSRWQHFKGGQYEVITHAKIEKTQADAIVYRCLKSGKTWVREKSAFLEILESGPRFRKISSGSLLSKQVKAAADTASAHDKELL